MRITESHLRRIIADESKKFKRGKRVNESLMSAQENLQNAMHEFYSEMANQSDHEQALTALQDEVMGFVEEYR
jgi:hypothetical protein